MRQLELDVTLAQSSKSASSQLYLRVQNRSGIRRRSHVRDGVPLRRTCSGSGNDKLLVTPLHHVAFGLRLRHARAPRLSSVIRACAFHSSVAEYTGTVLELFVKGCLALSQLYCRISNIAASLARKTE